MDEAAKNGHLDVVIWLHENRQEGCTGGAMDMAGRHGHLEVTVAVRARRRTRRRMGWKHCLVFLHPGRLFLARVTLKGPG